MHSAASPRRPTTAHRSRGRLLTLAAAATCACAIPLHAQEPGAVVEMTDALRFEPARVTIPVGATVRWTNPSDVKHTVTADPLIAIEAVHASLPEGAATFNSGPIDTGETYSHTFTVAGTYDYFCIPHELDGMVGTVVVEASGATASASQTAAAPGEERRPSPTPVPSRRAADDGASTKKGATFVFGAHRAPRHPEVRRATGPVRYLYWLGNFHPMMVSLPIGLLVGAALAELLSLMTAGSLFATAARFCAWAGGLGALIAGILGWLLAGFRITDGAWLLTTHRWLGSSTALFGLLIVALEAKTWRGAKTERPWFRLALFTGVLLVLVTGFFGGAMIYGLDHYALP